MPVPPLHPVTLLLKVWPAETVLLTAAQTELPLPPDSELLPPPIIDKPIHLLSNEVLIHNIYVSTTKTLRLHCYHSTA